jgi:hypothetical protein
MGRATKIVLLVAGLVLIGNFIILRLYGDTLQSTHLFVVRGTVFYPVAFLNLALGVIALILFVISLVRRKNS